MKYSTKASLITGIVDNRNLPYQAFHQDMMKKNRLIVNILHYVLQVKTISSIVSEI